MDAGERVEAVEARLSVFGFASTPVRMDVVARSAWTRRAHGLAVFAGACLLAPIAFLIPPHLETMLSVLACGLYFGRKYWIGEFVVQRFHGECPHCGAVLTLKPRTVLRFPRGLHCRQCKQEPVLERGPAASTRAGIAINGRELPAPPPLDLTAEELEAYKRRWSRPMFGSSWSPGSSEWRG